ncbi:hypothetical protein PTKIN_Ptkin15bG0088100 [Pterospermum kingtungense]
MMGILRGIWSEVVMPLIRVVGKNKYALSFSSHDHLQRVVENGPWSLMGYCSNLKEWEDRGFGLHMKANGGRSRVFSSGKVRFHGVNIEDLLDKGLIRNNHKCFEKSVEKVNFVDEREVLSKVKGPKVVNRGESRDVGCGSIEFRGVRIEELVINLLNGAEEIKDHMEGVSSVYMDVNFNVSSQVVVDVSSSNENVKQIVVYEEDQCNYIVEMPAEVREVYAVVGSTECEVSLKEFKESLGEIFIEKLSLKRDSGVLDGVLTSQGMISAKN